MEVEEQQAQKQEGEEKQEEEKENKAGRYTLISCVISEPSFFSGKLTIAPEVVIATHLNSRLISPLRRGRRWWRGCVRMRQAR